MDVLSQASKDPTAFAKPIRTRNRHPAVGAPPAPKGSAAQPSRVSLLGVVLAGLCGLKIASAMLKGRGAGSGLPAARPPGSRQDPTAGEPQTP